MRASNPSLKKKARTERMSRFEREYMSLNEPARLCSHDELKWGRKKEVIGGKEITVCGRCREEV